MNGPASSKYGPFFLRKNRKSVAQSDIGFWEKNAEKSDKGIVG